MAASGDRFVTLCRMSDPIRADMLRDLLEQDGIPVTTQGNAHSALLGGLAAAAIQVPVQVPERDLERASAILEAFDLPPEDAPPPQTPGAGPYRTPPPADPAPTRSKLVAICVALVLPMVIGAFGAGHFYVRSHGRGFVLLALGWLCAIAAFGGAHVAWLGVVAVVALDMAGALGRIRTMQAATA